MTSLILCLTAGLLATLWLRRWPQSGLRALLASSASAAGFALGMAFC